MTHKRSHIKNITLVINPIANTELTKVVNVTEPVSGYLSRFTQLNEYNNDKGEPQVIKKSSNNLLFDYI